MIEHHNNITGRDLKITSTNPYVPVVTLSIDGNIKLLKNLKQGFRIVFWNKYRSEIIIQPKKSNLLYDYMIDPTCRNIHWFLLFHSEMVAMILQEIILINITCFY